MVGALRLSLFAHTAAPDWRSRGNEAADVHAGSNVGSAVPLMTCEERFVFWRQRPPSPEHVSGNLRAVLRDIFRQRVTREWKCAPAQGELVREHGERLTRWLDVVRRAGNGVHLLVALQLSTLQTSTPSRLLWGRSREPDALLCSLCGYAATPRHPFTCPGTAAARRVLQHRVTLALRAVVTPLLRSETTSIRHRHACLRLSFQPPAMA